MEVMPPDASQMPPDASRCPQMPPDASGYLPDASQGNHIMVACKYDCLMNVSFYTGFTYYFDTTPQLPFTTSKGTCGVV